MKTNLLRLSVIAVTNCIFTLSLFAQNNSPYWSLAGNSNATRKLRHLQKQKALM